MQAAKTFQLKGSLFTLTVLKLNSIDFETFETEIAETIKQAPKFFENSPIVIDLQALSQIAVEVDFKKLIELCRTFTLIPIGVRNGNPDQHKQAIEAQLAILPNIKQAEPVKEETPTKKTADVTPKSEGPTVKSPTRVITQPVRSGKQIYAEGGDLLILAPVSHGAEVIADGNIHVYGPLRGRALAGVQGDSTARIFTTELDAELVSIAGQYKVSEELLKRTKKENEDLTHIYLDNGELQIATV